ncbi:sugar ABC transporter permease [Streptomyces sp. RFCAC02]|uniref:carbohydrate ABC transporter permease n=1 Tax=Streptomyces sp. RFCAC02 TaxID=2499143 RepID=UPI001F10F0B2|nr:sugar ABC transporter permease [Streptomyces sp. RFCAC02]
MKETPSVTPRAGRPGLAWAIPGVLFFAFFALVPLVMVVYLSFTDWDGLSDPQWTGFDNWSRMFEDDGMGNAIWLSLVLTVLTWVFQTPITLLLGVWAAGRQRHRAVMSAIFFLPLLASSVALALLWRTLFDPNLGLAADIAEWFDLDSADLLGTDRGAFAAILFVTGWQFVPLHMLIYQGGARQIPRSLYDAASIDGAGTVRQFFSITLPQLRNTIVTSTVLMVVGALTYFDTVLILTRGGPGDSTAIVPYLMYETGFQTFDLGYASAVATALVVVATATSLLLVRLTGFSRMRSTREGL